VLIDLVGPEGVAPTAAPVPAVPISTDEMIVIFSKAVKRGLADLKASKDLLAAQKKQKRDAKKKLKLDRLINQSTRTRIRAAVKKSRELVSAGITNSGAATAY